MKVNRDVPDDWEDHIKVKKFAELDRVGIEIEGLYVGLECQYLDGVRGPWVYVALPTVPSGKYVNDGSISTHPTNDDMCSNCADEDCGGCDCLCHESSPDDDNDSVVDTPTHRYHAREYNTIPFRRPTMAYKALIAGYPALVNRTCGMHMHFSTTLANYGRLCTKQFHSDLYQELYKIGHRLKINQGSRYWSRLEGKNTYCQEGWNMKEQMLSMQKSHSRYYGINYAYKAHKTVELRMFPAFQNIWLAIRVLDQTLGFLENWLADKATKGYINVPEFKFNIPRVTNAIPKEEVEHVHLSSIHENVTETIRVGTDGKEQR